MNTSALSQQLSSICQQRQTGTLLGVTDQGSSLVVAVKEGVIVGLSFRNLIGADAIAPVCAEKSCKFSFKEKLVMRTDADLPSTADILLRLNGGAAAVTAGAAAPADANAASTPAPSFDGHKILSIIEAEANKLFGPLGSMVVKEKLAEKPALQTMDDFRKLLHAVADGAGQSDLGGPLISNVMQLSGMEQRYKRRR